MIAALIRPAIGGTYNWKNQPERLVYLGLCEPRNGRWHQFALVDEPTTVWCEVLDSDLSSFEESEPTDDALERRLLQRLAEPTEIEIWNAAVAARKAAKKGQP